MNRFWRTVVAALILPTLFGCGGPDGGSGSTSEVTAVGEPLEAGEWTVSDEPILVIGSEADGEAYRFYGVEDARRLSDGRIVVSNAGTQEVRVFGPEGKFLLAFGRRGEGPGEFGSGSNLTLASFGDSLLVDDHRNGRVQLFDLSGQFVRSIPLRSPTGTALRFAGRLTDGRVLTWTLAGLGNMEGEDGDQLHLSREYLLLDPVSGEGAFIDTVPSRSRIVHQQGDLHDFMLVPFEIESRVVADGSSILVGHPNAPQIKRLDEHGQLMDTMRWAPERISTTGEMARYRSHVIESSPDQLREFWSSFFEKDLPVPDSLPVIDKMLIDEQENVWVERFKPVWSERSEWDVLSRQGVWLSTVTPPANLNILQVGSELVLGTSTDSLGIEQVVLHRLTRPIRDSAETTSACVPNASTARQQITNRCRLRSLRSLRRTPVLRELSRSAPEAVLEFVSENAGRMSTEALRNAIKAFPQDTRAQILTTHKPYSRSGSWGTRFR